MNPIILLGIICTQGRSQGVSPGGPGPHPIKMWFQIFRLNFSWNMSKIHYFSNKFSKIAKRWVRKFRDLAK